MANCLSKTSKILVITITLLAVFAASAQFKDNSDLQLFNLKSFKRQAGTLVVTAAGDFGATRNTMAVLKRIDSIKPDLNFALGDLSYSQVSEIAWCEMVKKYISDSIPFILLAGNHESDGRDGLIDNFAQCLPYHYDFPFSGEFPREYYVDAPKENPLARFIMISPNLRFADGQEYEYKDGNQHSKWLDNAIKDARAKNIPWIIVGMHKVCTSAENKSCEVGEQVIKQVIDAKVDVVLAGHVHAYERTYQLKCMYEHKFHPKCLSKGYEKSEYKKGDGTVFITVGTGGVNLRGIDVEDSEINYFAANMGIDHNIYGPALLEIGKNSLKHQFINAVNGKSFDSFTITDDK